MMTQVTEDVGAAYEDVRADSSETQWSVLRVQNKPK